jgi:hypothetical protein
MNTKNIESFARFLWGDSISDAQVTLLRVLYGLPLSTAQRSLWRRYSEKGIFARYSPREYREGVALLGRQSGKSSRVGVTVALYEALCVERNVPAGERLAILFFAPTLRQSTFDQTVDKLRATPELAEMVENDAAASGEVRLKNGIDLVAVTANPRTARGRASVLCIVDEAAYIRVDSAFEMNLPELLESIRPSLIVNAGKLLLLSSPSGKEGPLFEAWQNRGENPDVFVWRAPSQAMNPAIDPKLLAREKKRGDSYFRREYLAEFVEATNPFLPELAITDAIQKGVTEFPPDTQEYQVFGAVDTADKRDSNALAVTTVRDFSGVRKVVVLKTREWKPGPTGHNVLKILEEMGQIFRDYRVSRARGDQKNMSACESIFGRYGGASRRAGPSSHCSTTDGSCFRMTKTCSHSCGDWKKKLRTEIDFSCRGDAIPKMTLRSRPLQRLHSRQSGWIRRARLIASRFLATEPRRPRRLGMKTDSFARVNAR